MRFKIYSFIFVFIICFLLFSCTKAPVSEEMQENEEHEKIFRGDPLEKDAEDSLLRKIEALSTLYKEGEFEEIGRFYKETGVLMKYDGEMVQGSKNIEEYFRGLSSLGVPGVEFKAECVYAKKVSGTVATNIKNLIGSKEEVTHVAYAIINYRFKLEGVDVDPPSHWDGPHITGCTWR